MKHITKSNGLESIINGLKDGGVEVVTNFPGYNSHNLFKSLGGTLTSVNEEIAFEIAWGASFAGKRSVVTFKNVGLNNAADPFLNSYLTGVNAGLVIVVFDDVEVEGSQSRQDSRHYFDFFGGLWLEPCDIKQAYELAYKSFEWSEKFQLPVVIRVTNQIISLTGEYKRLPQTRIEKPLVINKKQNVVHPTNFQYQDKILADKNKRIETFVESMYKLTSKQTENKVISFGCCEREIKKISNSKTNIFQIFSYPIPTKIIKKFIGKSQAVSIIEQGDLYGFDKISNLKCLLKIKPQKINGSDHSSGYIISKDYEKLFSLLNEINPHVTIGGLGEYTKDTLNSIDVCLSLGSSLGIGIGVVVGGAKNVFAIIGDGAYLHSGKNAIVEAIERKIDLNIIILCNGGSKVTGGQIIPGDLYYQPKQVSVYKLYYQNDSLDRFKNILKEMTKDNKISVLYVQM